MIDAHAEVVVKSAGAVVPPRVPPGFRVLQSNGEMVSGTVSSVKTRFAYAIDRDDATPADIALRNWKKKWPYNIRVRELEFVNGTLANGVSLNDLMRELYWFALASTIGDHERGKGKTDPRRAFTRQAAVELSSAGLPG